MTWADCEMKSMGATRKRRLCLTVLPLIIAGIYPQLSTAGTYDNYDRFGNYEEFANPIPRTSAPIGEMTPEPIQRGKPLQNSDSLYRGVDKERKVPEPYSPPRPAVPYSRGEAK